MSLLHKIRAAFKSPRELCERVDRVDQEHREVRHDLRNTQTKVDALRRLVMGMRNIDNWERPRDEP